MRWFKFASLFIVSFGLVIVLNMQIGVTPPIGKFFDPFHGFWQNEIKNLGNHDQFLKLKGLQAPVTVRFDDRQIPHVFAQNDHDLYFAQGYLTARDRLWQMEFQTHAAAGRLCEILGKKMLAYDRHQRRIGMVYGAENALKVMKDDPVMNEVATAYTEGVNAYIHSLKPADYPVEYKILNYAPEEWTTLKCALLLKYMAWMLTGRSRELQLSATRAKFGDKVMQELFPDYPKQVDPIIPENTRWPFKPISLTKPQKEFTPSIVSQILPFQPDEANGSNNWAVSGEKTANSFPLLSNDPHLELSLPAIWYEMQLASPNVNVYGVTLPGAPSVIIGFNKNIAWGVTNSEMDVLDWYEIKFKDKSMNDYWYDGGWLKTTKRVEKIKIKGHATILDTVVYTVQGPVVLLPGEKAYSRQTPVLHALRWLGHDASAEALAFYKLDRAKNYDDYVDAIDKYSCPAQNFIFADAEGDIAIWPNGKFPARWEGQGKYISDGSDPLYRWQAWIPHEQNPHIKNPRRGFVSSANQNPVSPSYPYYFYGNYAPYFRGKRINQRLQELGKDITPDDFRKLQLDTKNMHAASVLPALIKMIDENALTEQGEKAFAEISGWNYFSDAEKIAPTIFSRWWPKLYAAIWYDEFEPEKMNLRLPSKVRTVQLIVEEPGSHWFDDISTEKRETLQDLVQSTFAATVTELVHSFGEMGDSWRWGKVKDTRIRHLARIPGFGRQHLNVGGDRGIVNAIGTTHGPSWRMVVQLGPDVKGWGIYPGGQSGNPGSLHYDDFVDHWVNGELAELLFLNSRDEKDQRIVATMELEVKK